jgi:hypothetical protein
MYSRGHEQMIHQNKTQPLSRVTKEISDFLINVLKELLVELTVEILCKLGKSTFASFKPSLIEYFNRLNLHIIVLLSN